MKEYFLAFLTLIVLIIIGHVISKYSIQDQISNKLKEDEKNRKEIDELLKQLHNEKNREEIEKLLLKLHDEENKKEVGELLKLLRDEIKKQESENNANKTDENETIQ